MTDYYRTFRKNYEKNPKLSVMECGIDNEHLEDALSDFIAGNASIWEKYGYDLPLTEQNWAEIKQVVDLWDSPLMKALR